MRLHSVAKCIGSNVSSEDQGPPPVEAASDEAHSHRSVAANEAPITDFNADKRASSSPLLCMLDISAAK